MLQDECQNSSTPKRRKIGEAKDCIRWFKVTLRLLYIELLSNDNTPRTNRVVLCSCVYSTNRNNQIGNESIWDESTQNREVSHSYVSAVTTSVRLVKVEQMKSAK